MKEVTKRFRVNLWRSKIPDISLCAIRYIKLYSEIELVPETYTYPNAVLPRCATQHIRCSVYNGSI